MTSLRRALRVILVAGFVAGVVPIVVALTSDAPAQDTSVVALFGPLVGWAFIGTGVFAWVRRPDNRFGALMIAVGFAWCATGFAVADDDALRAIGFLVGPLPYALLIHMLLAFPDGRLHNRVERWLTWIAYVDVTVVQWALLPFTDTTRDPCNCQSNPLLIWDKQDVANALGGLQMVEPWWSP